MCVLTVRLHSTVRRFSLHPVHTNSPPPPPPPPLSFSLTHLLLLVLPSLVILFKPSAKTALSCLDRITRNVGANIGTALVALRNLSLPTKIFIVQGFQTQKSRNTPQTLPSHPPLPSPPSHCFSLTCSSPSVSTRTSNRKFDIFEPKDAKGWR